HEQTFPIGGMVPPGIVSMYSKLQVACRRPSPRALLAFCALCAAPLASAGTVSGNLGFTSDYVWRGTTQTQGDFAAQAGLKWAADNGVYASAWGSNVEFAPETHASSELDLVLGWSGALSQDWALD